MKKKISWWRGIIFGLALIIAPAVLFSSCWEDLDDVLGRRGTKLIIKRVSAGENIKEAIENAMNEGADVLQVSKGTYELIDSIVIDKDIKIVGGYSEDFSSRNPSLYTTEIKVTLTLANNSSALWFYPGTTKESVLDGFTVTADISNSKDSSAIVLYGSSIISNCVITGPESGSDCHAVQLAPSSNGAIVMNNEIIVRSSGGADHGIFDLSTNVFIVNNIIRSMGTSDRRLISPRGGSGAQILNNILIGGNTDANPIYAIYIQGGLSSEIVNNILMRQSGSGTFYCVYEVGTNDDPAVFQNNNVHPVNYYNLGTGNTTSIDAVNLFPDIQTGGNIDTEMVTAGYFTDAALFEYRLSSACPSEIYQGGLNLTAEFKARGMPAKDKDGNPRPSTGPWAIGPYEKVE